MPAPSDLRSAVSGVSTLASRDLRKVWRQVDSADLAKAALEDVLPALIQSYGLASATVAADWYDDLRDDLNIDGRFSAIVADISTVDASALAGWSVGPLYSSAPDWHAALDRADGGMQLRIANAARETVRSSSVEDPKARGWQRSASMGCAFCQMLAGRGAVYTRGTVDFASHEHCKCVAVPAFEGHETLVKPYAPSDRNVTDADRKRVRAYLAQHHAG